MKSEGIFDLYIRERETLLRFERVLEAENLPVGALRGEFTALASNYRQLLEQIIKIIKVSDSTHLLIRNTSRDLAAALHQVQDLNVRLRSADTEKDALIALAAHDLRTPSSNIRGLSAALLDDSFSAEDREVFVKDIHTLSGNMLTVIEDLLDVYRFESGGLLPQPLPNHLGRLIEQVEHDFEPEARAHHVTLECVMKGADAILEIDWGLLRRVLDNLIANAIKFTPPEGRVLVTIEFLDQEVMAVVEDDGPGMTSADLEKLFRKFSTGAAKAQNRQQSIGLGLALVKLIVDSLGGRVSAENREPRGARFTVALPAKAV